MRTWFVLLTLLLTTLSGCADADFFPPARPHDDHAHGQHPHDETAPGMEHSEDPPHMGHSAGDHAQTGMDRPSFPPATGQVPTEEEAARLPQVSQLRFIGDVDLESSGYVTGNGTLQDPYVIEGLYVVGDLMLQDTDACVVIRENWVGGQFTLNWNAQCVHVHHNHIRDLRVNENIRRTGYATGGLLERNEIGYVGQLRHYDGEFRFNTVGPMPEAGPYDEVRETTPLLAPQLLIANIDGFNQAMIHGNEFHGSVDLDFHGHHHGTGFFATHSHYHGDDEERQMAHDHTRRWTSVGFYDNLVIDEEGYGLRYEDRNHAGDDRTARSEQEDTLELDHVHRTDVLIARNTVQGAGIWIDVFNADDARHYTRNNGTLTIEDNAVHLEGRDHGLLGMFGPHFDPFIGYQIQTTKELALILRGNTATYMPGESGPLDIGGDPETRAILIDRMTDADLLVADNTATGFDIGLEAKRFDDVRFRMSGNHFAAEQPTRFDDSAEPQ